MIFDNEQKRAIFHLKGPLLVIAGPGSGKTATMIERLVRMIRISKVNPNKILVITFSRASAREMEERFNKRVYPDSYKVHFGTFHSIFLRMLMSYYKDDFRFNLISDSEKKKILINLLKQIGFEFVINDFLDEFILDITLYKNSDIDISMYNPVSCDRNLFMRIYAMYSEKLLKNDFMDFDDILIMTNNLLEHVHSFRKYWQEKFDYILIDEFQDINMTQFNAIYKLVEYHNNIFAVGDEDQSIYGFRGSNPDIMINFKNVFSNAETIYLTNNYRSGYEIVSLACNLIRNNTKRYDKKIMSSNNSKANVKLYEFKTDTEQLNYIIDILLTQKFNSVAILCRTNSMKNHFINYIKNRFNDIHILTMHESKGLEFDTVIIPNVIDGICPYKHNIYGCNLEEERRLFYVAITRAKKHLFITYTKINKRKKSKRSKFIKELKIKKREW